ncbi:hypothetical protein [Streptomyces sp. NPDC017529]|uniref:hypothetical protein n=1 Tax=Streptomyces sp. NPDC017529 TaxID=3365000 RepID=UPI0037ABD94F
MVDRLVGFGRRSAAEHLWVAGAPAVVVVDGELVPRLAALQARQRGRQHRDGDALDVAGESFQAALEEVFGQAGQDDV